MENETIVYAVFKQGIYRHECGGVFLTKEKALSAAKDYALNDCDDYHQYAVIEFVADRRSKQSLIDPMFASGGDIDEPEVIALYGKPITID